MISNVTKGIISPRNEKQGKVYVDQELQRETNTASRQRRSRHKVTLAIN